MRVRLLTLMAGPELLAVPGTILDLPQVQAQALIEGGYAVSLEPVMAKPLVEAVSEKREKAVTRRGKR